MTSGKRSVCGTAKGCRSQTSPIAWGARSSRWPVSSSVACRDCASDCADNVELVTRNAKGANMSRITSLADAHESELDAAIARYLALADEGEKVDIDKFMAMYPKPWPELQEFLEMTALMEDLASH